MSLKSRFEDVYQAEPHVQGGEDAEDALSCRSLSAKEPLITELVRGK